MMPRLKLQLIVIFVLLMGAMTALAGSPHFIGTVSFSTGSFHMSGDLAGIGNTSVTVRLDAYAKITPLCQNKKGNTVPGHTPVSVTESTSAVSTRNGRNSFELVVPDPLSVSPLPAFPSSKAAGCNKDYDDWTVIGYVAGSTQWTGAKVSVFDNATSALLLQQNYSCTGMGTSLACIQT